MKRIEQTLLCKLYHNQELHAELDALLPGIFFDKSIRLVCFLMQELYRKKVNMNVENLYVAQKSDAVQVFRQKHAIPELTLDDIQDLLFDVSLDTSINYFKEGLKEQYNTAWARFVEEIKEDFTYYNGYNKRHAIIARAKALLKVNSLLFNRQFKKVNEVEEVAKSINSSTSYLRFASKNLTSVLGGFSKGFIATAYGKPSHNKSTYVSDDGRKKVKYGLSDYFDVISPEEPPETFWRRIFAQELGIPIKDLMNGIVRLTSKDIEQIKNLYEGKIRFYQVAKLKDIVDLLFALKTDYAVLDHVNAVVYPKGDMFTGITSLVNYQKQWLKENPESVLLDLTQVNTKILKRKNILIPSKEDIYNSSALEQASREIIGFYYPYKDWINPENAGFFKNKGKQHQDRAEVIIDKNSFGDLGTLQYEYSYATGTFRDVNSVTVEAKVGDKDLFADFFGDKK